MAVASRLAEWASVAVIEAGGLYEIDNGNLSVVPAGVMQMAVLGTAENTPRQPLMDWDLISVPQVGANNQRIHYAQGKTLGGSSAHNTMGYHRATKGSYQRWADLVGDQSYTFPNLLPFFKKSSHLTPPNLEKRNTPNATVMFDHTGSYSEELFFKVIFSATSTSSKEEISPQFSTSSEAFRNGQN